MTRSLLAALLVALATLAGCGARPSPRGVCDLARQASCAACDALIQACPLIPAPAPAALEAQ